MFKYRVIGSKMMGNARKKYTIQNLQTNEIFEEYASWISAQNEDDFINVRFSETYTGYKSFHIIKNEKVC